MWGFESRRSWVLPWEDLGIKGTKLTFIHHTWITKEEKLNLGKWKSLYFVSYQLDYYQLLLSQWQLKDQKTSTHLTSKWKNPIGVKWGHNRETQGEPMNEWIFFLKMAHFKLAKLVLKNIFLKNIKISPQKRPPSRQCGLWYRPEVRSFTATPAILGSFFQFQDRWLSHTV